MSYILDALNKSEQERQQKKLPNLKASLAPQSSDSKYKPVILVAITFLISASIAAFVFISWYQLAEKDSLSETTEENLEVNNQPHPEATGSAITKDKKTATTLIANRTHQNNISDDISSHNSIETEIPGFTAQQAEEIVTPQSITPQPDRYSPELRDLPNINELPRSIQQRLPDISFSTHIYASEPAWRMVGVNGQSRREGETISGALQLIEITEEGVIFQFQEYTFQMGVVRDWSGQ